MLSYQHSYHAGNAADVHKHALLAVMLDYLTQKDKPLSYIETHAGRGLYDLASAEALKTGEAQAGVVQLLSSFRADHPYRKVLAQCRVAYGAQAYPGAPMIASLLLRPEDHLHLSELHPAEAQALRAALSAPNIKIHEADGFQTAQALVPPTPRRGVLFMDPSYEIKSDYHQIPKQIAKLTRAWNVGSVALWYPILRDARHADMLDTLIARFPDAMRHEVAFPPAQAGHGMVGSGMFIHRPSFGLETAAQEISEVFAGA